MIAKGQYVKTSDKSAPYNICDPLHTQNTQVTCIREGGTVALYLGPHSYYGARGSVVISCSSPNSELSGET